MVYSENDIYKKSKNQKQDCDKFHYTFGDNPTYSDQFSPLLLQPGMSVQWLTIYPWSYTIKTHWNAHM